MRQPLVLMMFGVSLSVLVGCTGKGEVIPLTVQPILEKQATAAKPQNALRVAVVPFEDARSDKGHLGVRTHLWGGKSYFNVSRGQPGEVTAESLAKYLTNRGWKVVPTDRGDGQADVILSGRILDFIVNAKSGAFHTNLTATTRLVLQAKNAADDSQVRMTVNGTGSDRVFWFAPEDAETLVNEVLTDAFAKLIQDTTVEHKTLRLR